ncbi:MAG: SGNH/GDSL hydrolase family protein [Anaerolineae bacterium]|nr:SGNH/GDSL hydrolase family protein [Anaerolineae bacterium]MDQ7034294.1 SGNH/GDSL hydrolase family protein [Anaerolineae bacterium]
MHDKTSIWQKIALIISGFAFSVVLVIVALLLFPRLVPDASSRAEAGTTLEVTFRESDGDMFVLQHGRVQPPEEDTLLGQWTLQWDENGFRVPAQVADNYPIAAFGDSFTEGATVAMPWSDVLADLLNIPVQNFGYRGYGPIEMAEVAEQYLSDDERSWVLYAHFSGNDLTNANRTEAIERSPLARMEWLLRQASANAELIAIEPTDDAIYPVPVIIGGSYYEIAFYEELLWWQVAPDGGFLNTQTFNTIGTSLDTIAAQTNDETCRAVIFIPSKEQIYYPYIYESSRNLFNVAFHQTVIDSNNRVVLEGATLPTEEVDAYITRLGEQRDAMRDLAEEHGWYFIDLLEPFALAAAQEQLLYYRYDGHWNQEGHNLAAQVIADFMQTQTDTCPLNSR